MVRFPCCADGLAGAVDVFDPRLAHVFRALPLAFPRPRPHRKGAPMCWRMERRGKAIEADTPPEKKSAGTADALVALLYDELRTIARREHYRAGAPQTLQTTALINEAYMKLRKRDGWESQSHFLGCAATAIRHILIDAARARLASKRDAPTYSFTQSLDSLAAAVPEDTEVVKLGDALKALSEIDPELAQVVDCRFFAGLDEKETADVLGVSDRTVRRWWIRARAWIHREMAAA
jgi:RNA polymerase sigma factor (TIGR02999 family)